MSLSLVCHHLDSIAIIYEGFAKRFKDLGNNFDRIGVVAGMNVTEQNNSVLDALQWRYAVKKFDPAQKIPAETFDALMEATRLSASSYGMQQYKFIIVNDPQLRASLKEVSFNQPQITDASHMVVFAAQTDLSPEDTDRYMNLISETRGVPVDALAGFRNAINGTLTSRTPEQLFEWASDQTYIAIGTLLTAAALHRVDACPMEGFLKDKYDEILGLKPLGFSARAVVTLGYRHAEDGLANMPKVRKSFDDLFMVK